MNFKTLTLAVATAAVAIAAGSTLHAAEVNVYTHRHYDADKKLFADFSAQTGIKVNVVKAKADQLIERLKVEGKNSPADLLLTVDVGRLYKAKEMGLLQAISSDELNSAVPAHLRDGEGYWYSLTKRARVIVYAKERVNADELSTIEDLATDKWKKRVLIRSSSNIYNQSLVASLIAHNGITDTQKWAENFVHNFARPPKGNDRGQMRAVAAGLGDVAVVNTYYLGKLINGKDADKQVAEKLAIFWPNQKRGTHINVSGIGVTRHAKNRDNAIKLLEFLVSEKAQKLFAEANYEFPVRPGVAASALVQSWGSFKEDTLDLTLLGKLNTEAVKLTDRAGWK